MLARLKVSFSGREHVSYVQFKDFIRKLNIVTADESVQQLFFDHAVIHIVHFLESAMGQARLKVAIGGREYLSYQQFNSFVRKLDIVTLQESVQQLFFDYAKIDIIDFLEALYRGEVADVDRGSTSCQALPVSAPQAGSPPDVAADALPATEQTAAACPQADDSCKAGESISCASTAATAAFAATLLPSVAAAGGFESPHEWQARVDRALDGFADKRLSLDRRLVEAVDCLVPAPRHRKEEVNRRIPATADESGVEDMIRELLARRADPNFVTPMGLTMLESAISSRSAGGVEVLLGARADPSGRGTTGARPLQCLEAALDDWPSSAAGDAAAISALLVDALAARPPREALRAGDCVGVLRPFTVSFGDFPADLAVGQTGLVKRIDVFGDAAIDFRAHGELLVLRKYFSRLTTL